MKLLKRGLKIVVILVVLLIVGVWLFTKTLHPKYSGELELADISDNVTVYYDEVGVPHINAGNQKDAYTALGYVHAQDRLWQMELIRRIAAGRLAELFGKDLVRVDKFFSGLGIEEAANKTIQNLDKNSEAYKMTEAYLNGINQFIEEGTTPLEYYLVGVNKEKYTIKDVYNVFGYMAFSFAIAHKTDPLLTEVKEKLGDAYINELMNSYQENLTINKSNNKEKIRAELSVAVQEIMEKLPVSPFIGSNSWVIAPQKTKNGKVIFANDPHIAFSQPSVWYQSHLKTPDYEIYGFNLALMPFPLLGHNKEYAYGLTMLANDDLNFYVEENNPENANEYKTSEGYQKYKLVDKTIKVKGGADTTYQVKVSKHGPVMNGLIEHVKDDKPVAMNWIYTQLPNQVLEASYLMSHAKSIEGFKKGASYIHAPGLNVMYGDAKGNVGWFASAKLYQLRDSLSSRMYLNGASGKDEIQEYLDFKENPQAVNPTWNYVYSANNQPDSVRGKLYPGYYQPEDRAKRIVELLEAKNDFTKQDVTEMIYDVTSPAVADISKNLLEGVEKETLSPSAKKAYSVLKKWKGDYPKESLGATIYNRFLYAFLKETYKDELGSSFQLFIDTQLQDQVLAQQSKRKESVWWDNILTKDKVETREEIITKAFTEAVEFLQNQLGENVDNWMWKRVISVEYEHAIGKAGGALRKFFNVGPFETIGGNEVINNQIFKLDSTGYYKITAGPSTRRVIDFSDVENSIAIVPTGQSGNVFSPYYKDQAQKYVNGEFVKMKINQKEIEKSENKLVFVLKK
ncbi:MULTISPECIES: penicillin acylase family protein [unclassified Tenacibaculum]|uniref:penicillin acylase family protein n=1 Tax=unclassified Tenacibaculum TaxID=2635139 RepID=UPI001F43FD79|nr:MULTISPECIES: penicillin acylase family protein [unclassified Tenacibaculum]MCF2875358.1 penicillin acylase family protein [Tenacibaculum sp. Cn5-1]MCF2935434.1 penicillin acylase family protein [Tenacibaculum sp. Cn5-34]MCG7511994.1 penicillin acylase family protein [Tenacibaculum sp. Cn5-46]